MAGGKKKKSSSSKKKSRNTNGSERGAGSGTSKKNANQKPIPLEEVLSQAESAIEMANVDLALQLFGYAASLLRSRVHGDVASSSVAVLSNNGDIEKNKKTLATVLGKMGELKASNGDVEGARSEFLDAIELLGPLPSTSEGGDVSAMDVDNVDNGNILTAQSCESRAGLYLYLGQLSSETEALTSFRVGASDLERAVTILDRLSKSSVDNEDSMMNVEGVESITVDYLKRYLEETR